MRHIWLLAACLGVGGCVAPPAVTYLSFALDGVSLVITGKSVGDHALSAAVEKDCAMWRLLQEQDIKAVCREYADESETAITVAANRPAPHPATYTFAAAEVSPPPDSPVYAAASENLFLGIDPAKVPTETAAAEPETDLPSETVAATAEPVASAKPVTAAGEAAEAASEAAVETPPTATVDETVPALRPEAAATPPSRGRPGGYWAHLASFRTERSALDEWDRLRRRHPDLLGALRPSLRRVDLGGEKGVWLRVLAGPLSDLAALDALCDKLHARRAPCARAGLAPETLAEAPSPAPPGFDRSLYKIVGTLPAGTPPDTVDATIAADVSLAFPDSLLEVRRGPDVTGPDGQSDVVSAQNAFVLIAPGVNRNAEQNMAYVRDANHRRNAPGIPWPLNQNNVDNVVFSNAHNIDVADRGNDGDDTLLIMSFIQFKAELNKYEMNIEPILDAG